MRVRVRVWQWWCGDGHLIFDVVDAEDGGEWWLISRHVILGISEYHRLAVHKSEQQIRRRRINENEVIFSMKVMKNKDATLLSTLQVVPQEVVSDHTINVAPRTITRISLNWY